jgi:hypothetical protein
MTIHSVTKDYTRIEVGFKEKNSKGDGVRILDLKFQILDLRLKTGGEDRTRTCKRFPAVVFKTTALPIRLPLRDSRGNVEYIALTDERQI